MSIFAHAVDLSHLPSLRGPHSGLLTPPRLSPTAAVGSEHEPYIRSEHFFRKPCFLSTERLKHWGAWYILGHHSTGGAAPLSLEKCKPSQLLTAA